MLLVEKYIQNYQACFGLFECEWVNQGGGSNGHLLGTPDRSPLPLSKKKRIANIEGRKEGIGFYIAFNSLGHITTR